MPSWFVLFDLQIFSGGVYRRIPLASPPVYSPPVYKPMAPPTSFFCPCIDSPVYKPTGFYTGTKMCALQIPWFVLLAFLCGGCWFTLYAKLTTLLSSHILVSPTRVSSFIYCVLSCTCGFSSQVTKIVTAIILCLSISPPVYRPTPCISPPNHWSEHV